MAKYLGIPIALISGTSDSTAITGTSDATTTPASILYDTTANVFDDVKVGDVVLNTTTTTQATVTSIDLASGGILNISSNIFSVVSQGYSIYNPLFLTDTTTDVFDGIKVGDVVVNTVTMAQATVVSIDSANSGVLLLSSNIFNNQEDGYSIFSPNDDTRGNVLMSIDNYIIARDVSGSLTAAFSSGYSADTQTYLPIGTPVVDSFLTKLYLRWLERLLVTNATSNRLDIPLNEFYNNSSNVPYYIKTITLT